jgi:hypothetical protein
MYDIASRRCTLERGPRSTRWLFLRCLRQGHDRILGARRPRNIHAGSSIRLPEDNARSNLHHRLARIRPVPTSTSMARGPVRASACALSCVW